LVTMIRLLQVPHKVRDKRRDEVADASEQKII
jgi:hypothetical protein